MKILWITNTRFPAPSKILGLPGPVSGGWMYGMAEQIGATPGIQLAVATVNYGEKLLKLDIEGINYYLLPSNGLPATYNKKLEPHWHNICNEFCPDIIHIHGTEFAHGLACMKACPDENFIISIQGLVHVNTRYYYAGMDSFDIVKHISFRDLVRFDSIFQAKKKSKNRGNLEKEYLQRTQHVIGRTSWDFAHTRTINPNVNYHFCNESLRNGFYTATKWDSSQKRTATIFLSQAGYPIKGVHQVIKAVASLKNQFPELKIRIAGANIIKDETLSDKSRISGYGSYVRTLIRKYHLQEHIQFLGSLSEDQMIQEYQQAHLFICPSSIENSPNSLGEAQIIGTPCIASYVGGTPDMVQHRETGLLYRFEEIEMLAQQIRLIFTDEKLAKELSINEIEVAEERHNRQHNLENTLKIYKKLKYPGKQC